MRKKLTSKEKQQRKEMKRTREIKEKINSQLSILGFHRIFEYEDDDENLKEKEVSEANKKIEELTKLL
jgi:hypothetical protein